jgi:nucleotide-binding universal stress UspA family protein
MLVKRSKRYRTDGGVMSDLIAVGIDGTAASRAAVEWAVHRAESENLSLVLLHVAGNTAYAASDSDSLVRAELEYARAVSPRIAMAFEIHHGEPERVLAEEAQRFVLLVVGTHKTGFLRGRAFGSISLRLAAAVATPLAVIPISSVRTRHGVLVGIDDELNAVPALRHGADEALRLGSPLTLIYARVPDSTSPMSSALELVKNEYPGVEVRAREVLGVAGEVLINAAASAEVLFIGGPGPNPGLGAVGCDVLLNVSGPTILVPFERETATVVAN